MSTSEVIKNLTEQLQKNLSHTGTEFQKIRAGKASPAMLDGVIVNYYDVPTPITQVANINTPDARTISVQPWDKTALREIEVAIINSNLGFAPQNNGEMIMIHVPPVTEDRRKELVKVAKAEAENSKIGMRNLRKEANEKIKALLKDGISEDEAKDSEDKVQELLNSFIKKTDDLTAQKEVEIMTV
jgi:ribosome recycling factor